MLRLDFKKKTPSTPDFNFAARSSSSLTTGKFHSFANKHSSFMNTPLGNLHAFEGFSSTSVNSLPRNNNLKRSASTPNVGLHSRPALGSDEKKIISGFMNTPVMIVKTPLAKIINQGSPLSKAQQPRNLPMEFFPSESELPPSYVRETSSLELLLETSTFAVGDETDVNADETEVVESKAAEEDQEIGQEQDQRLEVGQVQDQVPDVGQVQDQVAEVSEVQDQVTEVPGHVAEVQGQVAEVKDHLDAVSVEEHPSPVDQATKLRETPVKSSPKSPKTPTNQVPMISLNLSPFLPPAPPALSSTLQAADSVIRQLAQKRAAAEQAEYAAFQQSLRAKARAEQERIEALAAANAKRLQKLKAGPTILPVKSTKPLTVPEEFHFEYESRAQLKKMAKPASSSNENIRPSSMSNIGKSASFSRFPTIGKGK